MAYGNNGGVFLLTKTSLGLVCVCVCVYIYIYIYIYIHTQSWSELLAPLINMIKEGCENVFALLILLIFILKNHKNRTFHWRIRIKNRGKYHYEINVFL